jgi:hypothetical protein
MEATPDNAILAIKQTVDDEIRIKHRFLVLRTLLSNFLLLKQSGPKTHSTFNNVAVITSDSIFASE